MNELADETMDLSREAALADELGEIDRELAWLKARRERLRDELVWRGVTAAVGVRFVVTRSEAHVVRLDPARVRTLLGAALVLALSSVGSRVTWRVAPIVHAAGSA